MYLLSKNLNSYFKTTLVVMIFTALVFILPSPVSFIFEVLATVYFAKIAVRHLYKYVLATGALIFAIAGALGGVYGVLLSGLLIVLLGLSLGMGVRLGLSFNKLMFLCTSLYLASTVAGIMIIKSTSTDMFSLNYFYETVNSVLDNMTSAGYYANPEVIDVLKQYLKQTVLFMMRVTPAIMIIVSIVCAFILIQVYKFVLIKAKVDTKFIVPFDKMRAGKLSAIVFIVLFFLYSAAPEGMFSDLSLNVLIILGFLFFACGLSLFDWRLKMRGTKKNSRRLIEIAILPISYLCMFIPIIALVGSGVIDSLLNFRRRTIEKQD